MLVRSHQPIDESRESVDSDYLCKTDSNRVPTELQCSALLYTVPHSHQYLAERRFTHITDRSALTLVVKSRYLSPKFHRWALKLLGYDILLRWGKGAYPYMPDSLSRLPSTDTPQMNVDDSWPPFRILRTPRVALDGVLLDPLTPGVSMIRVAVVSIAD